MFFKKRPPDIAFVGCPKTISFSVLKKREVCDLSRRRDQVCEERVAFMLRGFGRDGIGLKLKSRVWGFKLKGFKSVKKMLSFETSLGIWDQSELCLGQWGCELKWRDGLKGFTLESISYRA